MNTSDQLTRHLLDQLQGGDEDAAATIFARYYEKLLRLVESDLGSRMRVRAGAEDILQSAYRSFFRRAEQGEFTVPNGRALFSLLLAIAKKKKLKQIERATAQKRNVAREVRSPPNFGASNDDLGFNREPTPEEVAATREALASVRDELKPDQVEIFNLFLVGKDENDIVAITGASRGRIRYVLQEKIITMLKQRLFEP